MLPSRGWSGAWRDWAWNRRSGRVAGPDAAFKWTCPLLSRSARAWRATVAVVGLTVRNERAYERGRLETHPATTSDGHTLASAFERVQPAELFRGQKNLG